MQLTISNDQTISQIQDEFTRAFPGLKIEFVKHAHAEGEGSRKADIIKGDKTVRELSGEGEEIRLEITKDETVGEVESRFRDHLGLNVQVFRKAGLNWIETVNTDHWSIAKQMDSVR